MRYADNGQRLILLFLMPGDFIVTGLFEAGCCELVCLSPMKTVDASPLTGNGSLGSTPKSAALIAGSGRQYRLLLVDHLTRLINGCTTSSLASLLIEFHDRALRAGACENGRFTMPIGQRILARSLGRSSVQINKVMTHFQSEGWIKVGYDWISVLDPEALRKAGGMVNGGRIVAPSSIDIDQLSALDIDRLELQL
ncbi:MAG: helix-turn-helix domain-containing protein [Sphingomicrobium sp.]